MVELGASSSFEEPPTIPKNINKYFTLIPFKKG
jgi:hypothetical protein